jgi:hypothetical protein
MQISADSMKRINGHTLKVIACVTMLIDHITAGIMLPVVRAGLYPDSIPFERIKLIYDILRRIGRNSFPIFCFLLVEGFIHTKSRLRYALSLLIFGLISEPFFDATFYAKQEVFNINLKECLIANKDILSEHCNVYFTLLIGLLVIWGADWCLSLFYKKSVPQWLTFIMAGAFLGAGIYVANALHTDYRGYGVGMIFAFYIFRSLTPIDLIVAYCAIASISDSEFWAFPCFILLYFYNHQRGRKLGNLKYAFYLFYPLHIFLIYVARCLIYG